MTGPADDRELVRAAQAGGLSAFEELVRRHQRPLFGYLYRMCGNPAEAEELAQQAFVRAWGGIGRFRGEASFKTWLYRIATNLCINRATRRKPTVELPESLPAPEASEPAESYARARRVAAVRAALEQLPADQRAALVLVEYEEMSYREAARALRRSVRAVDSLIFRARQNLRRLLEPARRKGIV
ncbi:MAG TPA: RNA polymerase sigma factor [candidate division WOR-3 bacterium]|uniref:RNA polymerase sigma factor n=1 Tax=candidate division WOR-3 bacterium TaxID=2052148 RepID=A0A7V0T706_UNCW3|nr:RNA polymerase sigma factor [candidate division WOR-3 bacterium]